MRSRLPLKTARKTNRKNRGFTLIELLMVFTVIAILAGITLGITRGVRNTQNRAKAQVELAALTQALEEYKSRYGDYPWLRASSGDEGEDLAYALGGRVVLENVSGTMTPVELTSQSELDKSPKFIDFSKFYYEGESDEIPEALLDPWGNPYVYLYKDESNPEAWDVFGYHLYSTGPKGEEADSELKSEMDLSSGVLEDGFREVADAEGIIFAGE